jgi:hypothetical protein
MGGITGREQYVRSLEARWMGKRDYEEILTHSPDISWTSQSRSSIRTLGGDVQHHESA